MTGVPDGGCWATEGNVCSRLYPRIHACLHGTVLPRTPAEGADCEELMMFLLQNTVYKLSWSYKG